MHLFPKSNEKLRNTWIKFVQNHRPNWQPSAYFALCSAHFKAHDDRALDVQQNIVPTTNLKPKSNCVDIMNEPLQKKQLNEKKSHNCVSN